MATTVICSAVCGFVSSYVVSVKHKQPCYVQYQTTMMHLNYCM